jgi:glycosyltransferase involved in cell wall biosynthesis
MRITFFGAYDPAYPRNSVIRKGLRLNGVDVRECRVAPKFKFWARYPLLLCRWRRLPDFLFVPEFCQKDVPLAAFMGLLTARPVIFDPLAARYETKIVDWKWKPADSPAAWWNSRIDRAAFAAAGLVLADTEAHKSYYCETYGLRRDKVEVLPLGYDDGLFKPRARTRRPEDPAARSRSCFTGRSCRSTARTRSSGRPESWPPRIRPFVSSSSVRAGRWPTSAGPRRPRR